MNLREKFDELEERERKLLMLLAGVFGAMVVIIVPLGLSVLLSSQRDENRALRDAILAIEDNREVISKAAAQRSTIEKRYERKAPALAGFLAKIADQVEVDIPETKDRSPVPHGKTFDERSTQIRLRQVGLLALVRFMEKVEQSGYPVSVSRLNIRKRGTKPDEYDVEMIVSAFDRKEAPPEKSGEEEAEEEAASDEEEEP